MVSWNEVRSVISGGIVIITCPCHLPIILPIITTIMAGTGFGIWLASHQTAIIAVFTVAFLISLSFSPSRGLPAFDTSADTPP
jgi:hypothetical protein